jgi:nucleotide-binding universal stress UspA family protein
MTVEFKRIIVPIDFSPSSRLALEHAKALVTKFGGVLEVVHVVEERVVTGPWPAEGHAMSPQIEEALLRNAEHALLACLTKEERNRYGATLTLLTGPPAMTIVEHAASCRADLIVMGTNGRSGLSHLLLGSVAERVVRTASCPVLVVREIKRSATEELEPVAAVSA